MPNLIAGRMSPVRDKDKAFDDALIQLRQGSLRSGVSFEVVPVTTSSEAAAAIGPRL